MNFPDLVLKARTCRHFHPDQPLSQADLVALTDCARISPSARNRQALRFVLVQSPQARQDVRAMVTMGGAMKPEQRPGPEFAPGGYIIILTPEKKDDYTDVDAGIAAQSIQLAATDMGFGCCMIGNFVKDKLRAYLQSPTENGEALLPILVLALGKPAIDRALAPWDSPEAMDGQRRLPYFRDAQGVHRVPKRPLDDIIISSL